jgi:hypothetical protein
VILLVSAGALRWKFEPTAIASDGSLSRPDQDRHQQGENRRANQGDFYSSFSIDVEKQ